MWWRPALICLLITFAAVASIVAVYFFIAKASDVSDDVPYLTERDFEAAKSVKFEPGGYVPAEYNSDLFEGDIVQEKRIDGTQSEGILRNRIWPGGIVPYKFERNHFKEDGKNMIADAIQDIHNQTCVRFRPQTEEDGNYYIRIITGNECSSYAGRVYVENGQPVTLGEVCLNPGTIRHELMHALGFLHEQARTDRDSYVEIKLENIRKGHEHNFEKSNTDEVTKLGTTYDHGSLMHYHSTAFAKDITKPTIVRRDGGLVIGQRSGFSETDILEINRLYSCHSVRAATTTSTRAPTTTYRATTGRNSRLRGNTKSFNRHEYIYVQQLKTWEDAEDDCVAWGGHLVSFHSHLEDSVISDLHDNSDRVWIGYKLTDSYDMWSDKSSQHYIQTFETLLRMLGNEQSCLIQDGRRLKGSHCENRYHFVCKRK